jgi:hypothetical protein
MGRRPFMKRLPLWARIVMGVALVLVLGSIGVSIYLNRLVNTRLKEMVYESSDSLYQLRYDRISLNALTGNLTIYNPQLIPDTLVYARLQQQHRAPRFLVGGKTDRLSIKNVRWLRFLNNRKLSVGSLLVDHPQMTLTQYRLKKDSLDHSANAFNSLSRQVKDLQLGEFAIRNAVIQYQVRDSALRQRAINTVNGLDVGFSNVHFAGKPDDRHLAAANYHIRLKEYRHRTLDSMYWIGMENFTYQSEKARAALGRFYVEPRLSEVEFSRKSGRQASRYEIQLNDITGEGVDVTAFVENSEARIDDLRIGRGFVHIFLDRTLPPGELKKKVVLSQKIREFGLPIYIQSLRANGLDVAYKEVNPLTARAATLSFNKIVLTGSNLTNIPADIQRERGLKLDATASFMNTAPVHARFEFDLGSEEGNFSAQAELKSMSVEKLNPLLLSMASVETRNGFIRQLRFHVNGNEHRAAANVNLLYEDLKINLMEDEGKGFEKKTIKSMFANILIKDDNPKDGNLRKAEQIKVARNPRKSFFNLIWAPVAIGIQEIITAKKGFALKTS